MKLRIQESTIRLRLSADEIAALAARGRVRCQIRFGPDDAAVLAYSVEIGDRGRPADAELVEGEIRLFLRKDEAARLEAGGEVSVEGERPAGKGDVLRVRIEKDLAP